MRGLPCEGSVRAGLSLDNPTTLADASGKRTWHDGPRMRTWRLTLTGMALLQLAGGCNCSQGNPPPADAGTADAGTAADAGAATDAGSTADSGTDAGTA